MAEASASGTKAMPVKKHSIEDRCSSERASWVPGRWVRNRAASPSAGANSSSMKTKWPVVRAQMMANGWYSMLRNLTKAFITGSTVAAST